MCLPICIYAHHLNSLQKKRDPRARYRLTVRACGDDSKCFNSLTFQSSCRYHFATPSNMFEYLVNFFQKCMAGAK